MNLKICTCFSNLYCTHLLRRKLLAELVEDEKVAVEIARLEEEFRRLTEENRTLVTVHNERAQQLESLCLTDRTRQDSSWPLTSAEPETSENVQLTPSRVKGSFCTATVSESANYTEGRPVCSSLSHSVEPQTDCRHHCEVVVEILLSYDTSAPCLGAVWLLFCDLAEPSCNTSWHTIYTMSAAVSVIRLRSCGDSDLVPEVCGGGWRWCGPNVVCTCPCPPPLPHSATHSTCPKFLLW